MTSEADFRAPTGAVVTADVEWTEVDGETRLLAVVGPDDLATLVTDELFHLAVGVRPADLALAPGSPVTVELRPVDPLTGRPDEPASAWLADRPELLGTEQWFAAALEQPGGAGRVPTLWSYADAVGPGADPASVVAAGARFLAEQHPDLLGELGSVAELPTVLAALTSGTVGASWNDPLPAFEALLVEGGAEVERVADGEALAFAAAGSWGSWVCLAEASEASGALVLYGLLPFEATGDRLAAAYELAGRFNADRPTGTLQVDGETGRVVLRTSLLLDAAPSRAVMRHLLELTIEGMDEALPVVERFDGGATVEAALAG